MLLMSWPLKHCRGRLHCRNTPYHRGRRSTTVTANTIAPHTPRRRGGASITTPIEARITASRVVDVMAIKKYCCYGHRSMRRRTVVDVVAVEAMLTWPSKHRRGRQLHHGTYTSPSWPSKQCCHGRQSIAVDIDSVAARMPRRRGRRCVAASVNDVMARMPLRHASHHSRRITRRNPNRQSMTAAVDAVAACTPRRHGRRCTYAVKHASQHHRSS